MKYVKNVHTNGILCTTKDKALTKRFGVLSWDKLTGQRLASGYTPVEEKELEQLTDKESGCALFKYFVAKKKLIVYDKLPDDAISPHEALVSARQDAGKLAGELSKATAEVEKLKKENAELKAKLKAED